MENAQAVVTAKFEVSAGDVIGVAIAPSAAFHGVTAALIDKNGSTIAVYGGKSPMRSSIFVSRGGEYSITFENTAQPGITTNFNVTVVDCGNGVTLLTFNDGPVDQYIGRQSVTLYYNGDGSIDVWTASRAAGYAAFTVEKVELEAVDTRPLEDTLIKSDLGVTVHRLSTGDVQIKTDSGYMFICYGDTGGNNGRFSTPNYTTHNLYSDDGSLQGVG